MQINNVTNQKYNTGFGKKYIPPKMLKGTAEDVGLKLKNVMDSKYLSSLKLGEIINTGNFADVYTLSGWLNSYVVRMERTEAGNIFNPKKLVKMQSNAENVLYATSDKTVSIMKRIIGEPLHGKDWRTNSTPSVDVFRKTMSELFALPDETYEKYIDDVLRIREQGFDIDNWNPNNYLLDKKNKSINIIDLIKGGNRTKVLKIEDFYPFIDSKKLSKLCYMRNEISRDELADIVTKFIDRMIGIAKKKGYNLEMDYAAKEPLSQFYQNYAVLLYRRAKILFDK